MGGAWPRAQTAGATCPRRRPGQSPIRPAWRGCPVESGTRRLSTTFSKSIPHEKTRRTYRASSAGPSGCEKRSRRRRAIVGDLRLPRSTTR
ncbi:hypothetical protein M885DRAFT_512974 [Pelagophyceae sp. CCMP2097]|nr:hypothetical protein M885DRAFT_512974 [Pelagophyceae sp. CCMP2097]